MNEKIEIFDINGLKLCVDNEFRFGTDAVLLSGFVNILSSHVVCDLCSGSGIIPFMLCKNSDRRPRKIYSLDIAKRASELLKKSLELNNLKDLIIPVNEDLKNITQIPNESIDIVTVNPPYFRNGTGFIKKSKEQANARHELLCNIDDVVKAGAKLLKYGGNLKMCHIPDRLTDVIIAMRMYKIEPKKIIFISGKSGENTKPWLFLISGKKGAEPGLIIEHSFTEVLLK